MAREGFFFSWRELDWTCTWAGLVIIFDRSFLERSKL
jgi:hypothetical protein